MSKSNIQIIAFNKIAALKDPIKNKYKVSEIAEKQYNYEFDVFEKSGKVKVLVYFGKKGIKQLMQGNKDTDVFKEIEKIVNEQSAFDFGSESADEPDEYIGSDESGKGDFFGPLVVCAFYLNNEARKKLPMNLIRDSKELTDTQINEIASKIIRATPNNFEIISLIPGKYNLEYKRFGNLNKMLEYFHASVIQKLHDRFNTNNIIIDKFTTKNLIHFDKLINNNINIRTIEKAEKYSAVACASIMARYMFNKWFDETAKTGIILPKGSSNGLEDSIKKYFPDKKTGELNRYVKLHFKTSKKLGIF